ncbi:GumC family protein [Colwelliaceae bacterium BS250]
MTQLPSSQQSQFNDEIDLKHLWLIIYRRKWRIIMLSVVVTLFATIVAYSKTPIYVAYATMLIEPEQGKVLELNDVYGENDSRQEYYYTQLEIMNSTPVATRVVETLDLVNHPYFNQPVEESSSWLDLIRAKPEEAPLSEQELQQQKFDWAVGIVLGGTSISPITKTELVVISFSSDDPELAALIANAIVYAYISNQMDVNLQRIEKSAQWLNQSLSGLKTKLDVSEDKLQNFEEQNSLVDLGGIKSLAAKEIEQLSKNLLATQQEQKQTEQIYNLLNSNKDNKDALANLPDVLNHPSIKTINTQKLDVENKILELSLTYGPKHPKMRSANNELNKVQANINNQVERLLATIGSDYRKAQRKTAQAEASLQTGKDKYQKLTRVDSRRNELKQDVETNQNLYQAFFNRLKETAELQGFDTNIARITDPATTPYGASKPNKKLIIVLAFMLSVMVGVGATLLLEAFNSTIRSVDDIESRLGQTLLGIVPLIGSHADNTSNTYKKHTKKSIKYQQENADVRHFFNGNDNAFSEAVRTLRTSLQLLNIDKNAHVVAVTSTIPAEGKTMVTTNLAFAIGQLEKTILIDTDLRKPKIAKNFNIKKPGLSNYIAGNNTLEECIYHDKESNVDVLSAGIIPPNPQELLASVQFKELINTLKQTYDRIIIDTPPILAVSDAMIVAKQADTLIYVVKAESTKESQIKGSLKRLQQANLTIDGIVLNQVDLQKAADYQEFNGYYDQYGYSS